LKAMPASRRMSARRADADARMSFMDLNLGQNTTRRAG
jgi:hypothetical protein